MGVEHADYIPGRVVRPYKRQDDTNGETPVLEIWRG